MINNDYSRVKANRELQIKIVYKTMHCSTEKNAKKDSLKNPEGDSPQNQHKNGSVAVFLKRLPAMTQMNNKQLSRKIYTELRLF